MKTLTLFEFIILLISSIIWCYKNKELIKEIRKDLHEFILNLDKLLKNKRVKNSVIGLIFIGIVATSVLAAIECNLLMASGYSVEASLFAAGLRISSALPFFGLSYKAVLD